MRRPICQFLVSSDDIAVILWRAEVNVWNTCCASVAGSVLGEATRGMWHGIRDAVWRGVRIPLGDSITAIVEQP